ncbi:ATP-binding protein [Priestia koreensis]|uniref:ATP-binding protein n=1 Tax=Priestia koreensis TaxID=284581 RepID=UPI00203AD06B|nr:ATP-binding protein [Priestia koreensis]MCM3006709.1 ATP-binding protein [Priestia koreensis]
MNLWNDGIEMIQGIHCKADYKEQIVPENRGNPFIEALPNRISIDEFLDKMISLPQFESVFLTFSVEERLELIRQVRPSFWLPLPSHYEKYRGLYNMIKIGYQSRNPVFTMYNRQFSIGWDQIFESGLNEIGVNIAGNVQTAQSLAEIGLSGMGKSKVYERLLKHLFPQVIHHTEYKGKKLTVTQVVWLKIECPSGKSVGALCKNFYDAVDKILGSNFYEKYGEKGGTIDSLSKRMVKVAAQINLGVLIIDEIQNVHKAHSGGDQRMINFITELVNTIGIPVIIIGTFKALYLFKNSLANSRRGVPDEYSENIVSFMQEESWEWHQFIESLWDLQYTNKSTPLTDDLKKAFYYHSMGIPDIAVKLFMHVQSKAILNGEDEKITISLINEVASRSLRLLQPVFEKIRSVGSDADTLKQLEDVEPEWVSFNDYIQEANHSINIHGKLESEHSRAIQKKNKEAILGELASFAFNLVNDIEIAEDLANQVYNASTGMGDKQVMFKQLAQLSLGNKASQSLELSDDKEAILKPKKRSKVKPKLEETDIRFIVEQGLKKGMTTEESLEAAYLVRNCDELLNIV